MYKGTPDKNPGVSTKNDEKMKAPGQGSGPAEMNKPGEQSGQQREEKLQREDIRSHWNLDKGAHCHQGDKKCAEHQFP